ARPVTAVSGPTATSPCSSSRAIGIPSAPATTPTSTAPARGIAVAGSGTQSSALHAPSGCTDQPVPDANSSAPISRPVRITGSAPALGSGGSRRDGGGRVAEPARPVGRVGVELRHDVVAEQLQRLARVGPRHVDRHPEHELVAADALV